MGCRGPVGTLAGPRAQGRWLVATPRIVGPWVTVYRPEPDRFDGPDTVELTAGRIYAEWVPNDHTVVRGPDGRWHALGITHPITSPANVHDGEYQLFHAVAPPGELAEVLVEGLWEELPKALCPADRPGEPPQIYAPHVVRRGDAYLMVYGPDPLRLATSPDLIHWTPRGPLFWEEPTTRDPMLFRVGDIDHLIYCSLDCVMMRTSADLRTWGAAETLLQMPDGIAPESPFMVEREGAFYLFVCGYDGLWDGADLSGAYQHKTWVFRSDGPNGFDPARPIAQLDAHAPEVIRGEQGGWYLSSVEWPRRGLSIAEMAWE